jgi:proline-specific peptidase
VRPPASEPLAPWLAGAFVHEPESRGAELGRYAARVPEEGRIEVTGGRVWYRRDGAGERTPLLILHGGPGAASYYVEPLAERLAAHRPTVVYDQLGCGRSDKPDDPSLWTLERSVAEVDQVRRALGLDRCHLLGQSWGGWLSIEYMCRGPQGIAGLVLASTSASLPQFVAEARRLIEELPEPARTTLKELGARGEYRRPEYGEAVLEFYRRHVCRLDPWPEAFQRTEDELADNQVYLTMNGPTEFDVIGNLRDWDRSGDLHLIAAPTLVTVGRYDEITPACSETLRDGIPGARMVVFERSAHCAHLEEPEHYAQVVEEFLTEVDAAD